MASSQATSADLTKRTLRPLTSAELTWASTRLADAFNQILVRRPSAAARIEAGNPQAPFNQLVIQIQVAMLLRVLANPDYIRQQGIDDSTTVLDQAVSSGALYLSDDELALLSVGDGASDGAWTIRAIPDVPTISSNLPAAFFQGPIRNQL